MNRVTPCFPFAVACRFCFCVVFARIQAQTPSPRRLQTPSPKPAETETDDQEDRNPFAPEPAAPLPAGMTGSDANDPRAKLARRECMTQAETSMGIKHLMLVKKPDAFQLGSDNPDDPKVQKTLGLARHRLTLERCRSRMQLVIAQLAFANSDLAFQGNHLFQGNFYGINIYDISNPAKTSLLTSMVCPGGQGDVSVYKNLLFMSVEMPNGRLDCGTQGFPPRASRRPPAEDEKAGPCRQRKKIVSAV